MSTNLQNAADSLLQNAAALSAASSDNLKTANPYHWLVQNIRKQVEAEYKAEVGAESEAAADVDRKPLHAEDMGAICKRLCSAFQSLVKAKGSATGGFSLLSAISIICSPS